MTLNLERNNYSNQPAAVDHEALLELEHLVEDEFPAVVERYLTDGEKYIRLMDAAFKKVAFTDLHHLAHTFKSSSATLSAIQLYTLCDELEQVALNNPSHRLLAEKLNAIESEFKHVRSDLLRYLKNSTK